MHRSIVTRRQSLQTMISAIASTSRTLQWRPSAPSGNTKSIGHLLLLQLLLLLLLLVYMQQDSSCSCCCCCLYLRPPDEISFSSARSLLQGTRATSRGDHLRRWTDTEQSLQLLGDSRRGDHGCVFEGLPNPSNRSRKRKAKMLHACMRICLYLFVFCCVSLSQAQVLTPLIAAKIATSSANSVMNCSLINQHGANSRVSRLPRHSARRQDLLPSFLLLLLSLHILLLNSVQERRRW